MWLTSSFLYFVLCSTCAVLVNGSEETEELTSLLGRTSTWQCSLDSDCTVTGSSCVDGYCVCDTGYIYSSDLTACLLVATAYGDACTEQLQCSTYLLSGATCEDEVCVCGDGYHYTRGRCYLSAGLGESCSADVNCYVNADTEATSCVDGVCVCSEGFYQREYRTCRRAGYYEGDECAVSIDCKFDNAACNSSFVCTYSSTDTAKRSIDDAYELDYNFYGNSRSSRSLGRDDETAVVGTECESDDDCSTLENSFCSTSNVCTCNRAYYASSDSSSCLPEIGEDCSTDDEVSITNSLCRNGTWSCGYATVASISQKICRKTTKSYNFSCLHDEQCYIFGPDSSCQSKRCLCDDGSHLVEDLLFCWVSKGIGESCQADEDCYVEGLDSDLSCTDSVCTCPTGTSPSSDNTACKQDNAVLGEICDDDADCSNTNAVCVDLICACPDYYYEDDDACVAGINSACSSDSDCTVANSTCSDSSVCECSENFVSNGIEACLPVAAYGEDCESDDQCSAVLANTYCEEATTDDDSDSTANSTCACSSGYHYNYEKCYAKIAIGSQCTSLADCYVESGAENVVCRSGVCACSYASGSTSTTSCLAKTSSDATTFFLSTSLGLTILVIKIFIG